MIANKTLWTLPIVLALLVSGCTAPPATEQSIEPTTAIPDVPATSGVVDKPVTTQAPAKAQNPYAISSKAQKLTGSGATFPKPLIEAWAYDFASLHPTVQISYAGGGSGKGITDITKKDVLFAGSDAPLTVAEKEKAAGVLHIPETLGLDAVVYNVEGVSNGLKLTGEVIGQIYVGKIKRWNDPAITGLNPGVNLPDKEIAIVYRSDSSGTTFVFTDFLARASTSWQDVMGKTASKKPDWTKSTAKQLSGNGNDGVGQNVKNNPNTIGYVEFAYVKLFGLNAAQVQNQNGEFMAPTADGAAKAAAASAGSLPKGDGDWSKVSISNPTGAGVYPISSFSYMLVYDSLATYGGKYSADQMNAFRAWVWWGVHDGQGRAVELGYAPLPAEVVKLAEEALASIKV